MRTFRPLHAYFSHAPITSCDVSARGLLALGAGRRVQVWKDALSTKADAPYLNHHVLGGALRDVQFCPFEDVLGVGHSGGVSTLLVPGAGEAHYDSLVADPFQVGERAWWGGVRVRDEVGGDGRDCRLPHASSPEGATHVLSMKRGTMLLVTLLVRVP